MSNYEERVQAVQAALAAHLGVMLRWSDGESLDLATWETAARTAVDALDKMPAEAGPAAPTKPWPTPRACQHQAVVSHTTNPPTHKCLTCKNPVVRKGVRWETAT